jgi:nucleotide-binding universal stress UspA family protein
MQKPAVVVGTDGTEPGTAAVRWAATEADSRRLPLRVVHVLDWDWSVSRYDYQGDFFDSARRLAETTARQAACRARDVVPSLEIEYQMVVGHPVTSLARLSRSAALLVVGSRGTRRFGDLWLGSVSRRVAVHAHCPVAVVRGHRAGPLDPVAVAVDDSSDAASVLEAGFHSARRYGVSLVAVRSYRLGRTPARDATGPERDDAERGLLTDRLAPWRTRFPDVPVDTLVSTDSAATTLVDVSHGTRLVVVGNQTHGLFNGALRGSDTTRVLHRAHCPVLVVPEPRTRKDHHESTYR